MQVRHLCGDGGPLGYTVVPPRGILAGVRCPSAAPPVLQKRCQQLVAPLSKVSAPELDTGPVLTSPHAIKCSAREAVGESVSDLDLITHSLFLG